MSRKLLCLCKRLVNHPAALGEAEVAIQVRNKDQRCFEKEDCVAFKNLYNYDLSHVQDPGSNTVSATNL